MSNNTKKATITQVQLGTISVQGLMLPDGTFAIAATQVADLFLFRKADAARDVKALCGKASNFRKIGTEIAKRPIPVLTLEQFSLAIQSAAKKGNQSAIDLSIALVGLSLQQLWCDAFGIKFEEKNRQAWLKQRLIHLGKYHDRFTPWTKHDLEGKNLSTKEKGIVYAKRMNALKQKVNLPLIHLGEYDRDQLQILNDAELEYHTMRKVGLKHLEAISRIT